jgi:hypothetical protein
MSMPWVQAGYRALALLEPPMTRRLLVGSQMLRMASPGVIRCTNRVQCSRPSVCALARFEAAAGVRIGLVRFGCARPQVLAEAVDEAVTVRCEVNKNRNRNVSRWCAHRDTV